MILYHFSTVNTNDTSRVSRNVGISLAKRKCGLGLLTTRFEEITASAIALSIMVLNF